jgi:hypothetical protein
MRPLLFEPQQAARRRLVGDWGECQPRRTVDVVRASTQDKVGVLPQDLAWGPNVHTLYVRKA